MKVAGPEVPIEENLLAAPAQQQETVFSDADEILENFSDEQVITALRELSEEQRLALFLVDVEQMSQDEVAQITDVAVGTVKSRTSRARTALKSSLADYAREMNLGPCTK